MHRAGRGVKKRKKRQSRYLEPITSAPKRRPFVVVDIESKDGDSQHAGFTRPFLVGLFVPNGENGSEYHEFRDEPHLASRPWQDRASLPGGCVDKLLTFLLARRFDGYDVYAHNGGNFDHLFFLSWLRQNRDQYNFEIVPVQSSIQVLRVWQVPEDPEEKPDFKLRFLDSMKLLPMGLEKACKTFGVAGKVEHDLDMHENDERWSVYLKQDCVALADVLTKAYDLIEVRLGGEVGVTTPATSMKLFRRQFLGRNGSVKRIPRHLHWPGCVSRDCDGCAEEWYRRGYYGGRTEPHATYGERLHYFDFNSSYVAALREDQPVGDRSIHEHLDESMAKTHAGFVECTVYVPPECTIPPLPYRADSGKLIFPAGTFSGVWSWEELQLLSDPLVNGRILHVKKAVWFRKKPVFREMVDTLWAYRDKSNPEWDEGLDALSKLLGNGLYGKFGMRKEREQVVFAREPSLGLCFLCGSETGEPDVVGGICADCVGSKAASTSEGDRGEVWYQAKKVDADYIIPQIAAHVTALARKRLWLGMKRVIEMGGHVFYTDTDSIICDVKLPSSTLLGELKDEYPGQTLKATFVQPKVYMVEAETDYDPATATEAAPRLKGKHLKSCKGNCKGCARGYVTMKGFPRSVRTPENLARLRAGEEVRFQNLEKVRTLARRGFKHGPRMAGETAEDGKNYLKKGFRSPYDKRILVCVNHGAEEGFTKDGKGKKVRTGLFMCGCEVARYGSSKPIVLDEAVRLEHAAE